MQSFDRNFSVISNPLKTEKFREKKWIMLPMYAQKVSVSCVKKKNTNIFQELILKLFRDGRKESSEIAEILKLEIPLVEYILEELIVKEYLKRKEMILSEKGIEVLKTIDSEKYETEYAYVFYDLIGNFYWKILMPEKEFIEYGIESNRFDELSIIREEDPIKNGKSFIYQGEFTIKGKKIMPKDIEVEELTTEVGREIVKGHISKISESVRSNYLDEESSYYKYPFSNYQPLKLINEKIPVFVTTYIYVPDNIEERRNWQIADPFGFGTSNFYKGILEEYLEDDEVSTSLNKVIHSLYSNISLSNEEIKEMQNLKSQNEKYLDEVFPLGTGNNKEIKVKLLEIIKEYNTVYKGNNDYDTVQKAASQYIQGCYYLLETVLDDLLEDNYSTKDKKSAKYKESASTKLQLILKKLKFNIEDREVSSFLRGALSYGNKNNLQGLFGRNILQALEDSPHPFNRLSREFPNFPSFVMKLKNLRNEEAHSSRKETDVNEIKNLLRDTLKAISILIENIAYEDIEIDEYIESDGKLEKKQYQIAEGKVENTFSKELEKYPILKKYIVQSQVLLGESDKSSSKIPLALGKVYEELLNMVRKHIYTSSNISLIKEKMDENIVLLLSIISSYSFEVKEKEFKKKIKSMKADRMKMAFENFEKSVLSGKLTTIIFSLHTRKKKDQNTRAEKKGRELSKYAPNIFSLGIEIDEIRGHGDKEIEYRKVVDTSEELYQLVENILKFMKDNEESYERK